MVWSAPNELGTLLDIVSPTRRSKIMGQIRSSGTKPELAVRKCAYRLGFRYRLNRKDLPGSPDLVFPKRNIALFVHGCFWHRHKDCKYSYMPKSRVEFWEEKFDNNVARDKRARRDLEQLGWRVVTIWECETKELNRLSDRLRTLLGT